MSGAQATWVALMALAVGLALAKHGQKRTDSWDARYAVAGVALQAAILWWGGFWA